MVLLRASRCGSWPLGDRFGDRERQVLARTGLAVGAAALTGIESPPRPDWGPSARAKARTLMTNSHRIVILNEARSVRLGRARWRLGGTTNLTLGCNSGVPKGRAIMRRFLSLMTVIGLGVVVTATARPSSNEGLCDA